MLNFFMFLMTPFEIINFASAYTDPPTAEGEMFDYGYGEIEPRIKGGKKAYLGQYPWITYITYKDKKRGREHFCGGSILSENFVLTAAHCCRYTSPGSLLVRVGEHNLRMDPDCKFSIFNWIGFWCIGKYKSYKATEMISYRPFNWKRFVSGDICLVRVNGKIQFDKYVSKIELPFGNGVDFTGASFVGQDMYAAGWGKTRLDWKPPKKLLRAKMKVISLKECKRRWEKINSHLAGVLNEEHICAGLSSESDICHGDSGGPLMYPCEGKTYIVGVAIASSKCIPGNRLDIPGVYLRVDSYKNWIKKTMENNNHSVQGPSF